MFMAPPFFFCVNSHSCAFGLFYVRLSSAAPLQSSTIFVLDVISLSRYVRAVKGYGQYCPVAKATEILNERWTLLVLRELLFGSRRFNDLRKGVPLMSPTLLSKRLKFLEEAGGLSDAGLSPVKVGNISRQLQDRS